MPHALKPIAAALAALFLCSTLPALAANGDRPSRPPFPELRLPVAKSQGQRAIDLLGSRLPEVAAWYGKSAEEFRALLLKDRRLKLDARGRLFVEEELDQPLPADPAPAASSGSLNGQLAPLDQTFALHSRPGAKRTIHLNFQGAVLTNTAWNGSGGTITALPFDLDGVPYVFSAAELERIQYIWQRVAEDYAPFDVNVTTETPAGDLITRSGSGDDVYGTTVVVTKRSGVYDCSCGGVAYIGVFDNVGDFYKPALVFYDALGNGNEKYVAEAISHEAGHNGGLLHDGYSGGGYYSGHGSGVTGWAPIMGVGYYQALVQWSKGEYATADNSQDDYAAMVANGLSLRADDHGGTPGTASPLQTTPGGSRLVLSGEGVLERPGDVDVFSFAAGAGAASFSAGGAVRSPNVDLRLELRNGAGTLLASSNPAEALTASMSTTLPAAGTYFLAITGVGKGDPLTTGYTAYGSTGQYAVTGDVPAGSGQPPQAVLGAQPTRGTAPLSVAFSAAGSSDADGSIVAYAWRFGDGSTASGATAAHTYNAAGSYTAELVITDNSGMTATRSTTITVDPVVAVATMSVADIAMALQAGRRNTRASATVTLRDNQGQPVSGASVTGRWSGIVSGSATLATDALGRAVFNSPQVKKTSGTFTFTVESATLDGYSYTPALNVETSDSITR